MHTPLAPTNIYNIDIFSLSFKDPRGNKIKQWRGLQDVSGVITNYMLMDTQPILGNWRIKVTANVSQSKRMPSMFFDAMGRLRSVIA